MNYKKILEDLRNLNFNTLTLEEKKALLNALRKHTFLLETDIEISEADK